MKKFKKKTSKVLKVRKIKNKLDFHNHQSESFQKLTEFYREKKTGRSLIVIPTAGGKTHVVSSWLMKYLVDDYKKVIWLAHTHYLLDDAVKAFKNNCNKEYLPNRNTISINVISGLSRHNNVFDIEKDDDIIIASKDCLLNNLEIFKQNFLDHNEEIFIVIDEAHHSVAPTYRKLIQYIEENTCKTTMLGLTATPVRSSANESLLDVFPDDIIYSADLFDLVKQCVIALPIFIPIETEILFIKNEDRYSHLIENDDDLPIELKRKLAYHRHLNQQIIQSYSSVEYGKTIVFAIDQDHAVELTNLFNNAGYKAKYVISNSTESQIKEVIDDFKANRFDILVNVNILTEGVNYPDVKSIFLTRPTSSKILFNQMMGRALRGVKAGGTEEANIVCFIKNWEELISWTSPKTLMGSKTEKLIRKINPTNSIHKDNVKYDTQLFQEMLNETIQIQKNQFKSQVKKIPVGWYDIENLNIDNSVVSRKIIVYKDQELLFDELCRWLPLLCKYNQDKIPHLNLINDLLNQVSTILSNLKYDDIWYFMNHQLQFNEPPRFKSISIGNDSKDISLNYNKVA